MTAAFRRSVQPRRASTRIRRAAIEDLRLLRRRSQTCPGISHIIPQSGERPDTRAEREPRYAASRGSPAPPRSTRISTRSTRRPPSTPGMSAEAEARRCQSRRDLDEKTSRARPHADEDARTRGVRTGRANLRERIGRFHDAPRAPSRESKRRKSRGHDAARPRAPRSGSHRSSSRANVPSHPCILKFVDEMTERVRRRAPRSQLNARTTRGAHRAPRHRRPGHRTPRKKWFFPPSGLDLVPDHKPNAYRNINRQETDDATRSSSPFTAALSPGTNSTYAVMVINDAPSTGTGNWRVLLAEAVPSA